MSALNSMARTLHRIERNSGFSMRRDVYSISGLAGYIEHFDNSPKDGKFGIVTMQQRRRFRTICQRKENCN